MLYCCCLAFFLAVFLIIKFVFNHNKNLPPSPFALPIIGHLHLLKQPLHTTLETLLLKYGPVLFLRTGCRSMLVLSSPSAVEECFTKNDVVFANRPLNLIGDTVSYNYTNFIFAPYGYVWRILRRVTVVELLCKNSFMKSSAIRQEEVHSLLRLIYKVSNGGTQKVNLGYMFQLLTFNIIMKLAAGKKCVEDEAACTDSGMQYLMEFKDTFFPHVSMTMIDFFPFLKWIGFEGMKKSLIKGHQKRDEILQDLLDEIRCKKTISSSDSTYREKKATVIENLLSLQDSDPDFFTDDIVKSIVMIMLFAGTDTPAVTLEWAMSLLLNHPDELKKLKAEIDSQVGQERLLNELDLPHLPYLRCVIYESLRLYPTVPLLLPHCASEDCVVEGYKVPQGTILMVNAWAMHRDPKVWEEPTRFMPERFRGIEGEKRTFKFVPFGMGRRQCPGAGLGTQIVMLTLGTLLQCFEWERIGPEMVDMSQDAGLALLRAKHLEAVCRPRIPINTLLPQPYSFC